jgi:hypothetical protein
MRNGWAGAAWLGLVGLLLMVGCGEKNAPGGPSWPEEDGSLPESDAGDAQAEEDTGDGEPDAGEPDAGDGGELSQCEGDVLEFPAANAPGRSFSAALSGNRAHLVYLVASGGGSLGSSRAQGLRRVSFDTTGEPTEPVDIVNVGIDTYWKTRDPALLADGDALELFYSSNQDGAFELYHKDLEADTAPVRETSNAGRNEFASAANGFGGKAAVVYSDEAAQTDAPSAITFKYPGEEAKELIAESAGYHASRLALAAMEAGGALAFVSDLEDSAGIYLQRLSAAGDAEGELTTLSEQIGAASSVAIAKGRQSGGAVVYTVAPGGAIHQLRFRSIDASGEPSAPARSLTSANQDLLDVALASYSHGYVVAFRRLGGAASAAASIYLMFVDADGNVSGTRLVRSASASGRGMQVMVANDGRLIVVWSDTETVTDPETQRTETELRVRVARVLCAL